MKCNNCGSLDSFFGHYPGLVKCANCSLVFADINFELTDFQSLYGVDYFHGDEYVDYLGDQLSHRKNAVRKLTKLKRLIPPVSQNSLVEIGCAYGFFLDEAAEMFSEVRGYDISEEAVAWGRKHLGVRASSDKWMSMEKNASVDCVVSWDTIEHIDDPSALIEHAYRILNPGGTLALTTGDLSSLLARFQGKSWRQIHPPTHLYYFSREVMRDFLQKRGFVDVRISSEAVWRGFRSSLIALARTCGVKSVESIVKKQNFDFHFPLDLGDLMFVSASKPINV